MRINESVTCANFGNPRSRDRELTLKKTIKNGDFWLGNLLIIAYTLQTSCRVKLKFVHNASAYKWFMQTEYRGYRSRDQQ